MRVDHEEGCPLARLKMPTDVRRKTKITDTGPTITEHITMKKYPHREFVDGANEYCSLSPSTFKNIREQMALSLERTRQLEEQMKQLPVLKVQIATLEDENKRLLRKLEQQKENMAYNIDYSYLDSYKRSDRSISSEVKNLCENGFSKTLETPSTKDVGVTCTVLTRNVGVGHQTPNRKNVATITDSDNTFADKWFGEKLKFISDKYETESSAAKGTDKRKATISVGNQTDSTTIEHQTTQTIEVQLPKKILTHKQVQTLNQSVTQKTQSVLAKPSMIDFSTQKSVELYNVGVSEDTITDTNCEKCNVAKISVAVGADKNEDSHVAPVSLASLSFPRSKSFNLGEDKLNLNIRNRSIAVQYQYRPENSTKGSQYEASNVSRSSQYNVKTHTRGSQHEVKFTETSTQSDEVRLKDIKTKTVSKRDVSCEAVEIKPETHNVGCNTTWAIPTSTACAKCQTRKREEQEQKVKETLNREEVLRIEEIKREESKKKDDLTISRIPRLSLTPTMERRTFRRQDTYTKINTSPPSERRNLGLSGLDLSPKSSTASTSSFDRVKENFKILETSKDVQSQNELNRTITVPVSSFESSTVPSTSHSKHRKKALPSKEMQGAMKVLNDSLQKQTKLPKSHRAIDIIQQEWFKMSGLISANPLDVEDYLDAFEDMSSLLLDYIVNMTDASGNTAMHYAVSHGNFDVVSILLDSKVCDINKPNKAGYTSVMLVSLADIRSQTHANVVRRLFQMSDVNIRAKQHGQTALMLAVSHGRLDMVKMLLEAGADINIQDDDGSTALMCAAEHGHIEIVKHFLSQPDCDSTITDVDGSTALKIAMEAEHRPIGVLLYAHERNLMVAHGHKHKKKSSSPKPPSSPLSVRQNHSALNDIKSK